MPKLARNSVGGLGVGVKSWGFKLFIAIFAFFPILLIDDASLAAPSGKNYDETAPPISAEIVGPDATVTMSDDMPMYRPETVTIRVGQTIEWKNEGAVSHSVTDDAKRATTPEDALIPRDAQPFNSGSVMPGKTFRHTFLIPGRYRYFCLTHEVDKMLGEVIVEEAPSPKSSRVAADPPKRKTTKAASSAPAKGSRAVDVSQPWRYVNDPSNGND